MGDGERTGRRRRSTGWPALGGEKRGAKRRGLSADAYREGDARRSGQRRRTDAMRRRTKPGEMHDMT
ncbi:hypothetical protein D8O27_04360 [Burkholderia mallei]|uniref:Uncharacterized protein n=1 Tax=Burkholderia mallei TaxID=13373 RepID=A0AAX1X4S1_BURML|nr:hypothetical protein BMASAVP1_A2015 [Burkholderia mallei SAVP1]ARK50489.1 hypothetical protein BOC35_31340 [Burkholderia pseudomallei]EDK56780.1 hypothetical protein BMAFMH_C1066 [Burkholderia mallei FMH]EDK60957.1 hypothetical protein BMAJHU_C1126 [Burkholderia mallei JHU]EDK85290.1 hypothetical protein BMA721280_A0942 [Burkholderia mallei 2002721280]EDP89670.1 hypothetical protein BMA10399_E1167 [Burkholderia mallei ATCC 10399]EDS87339.1 hypothetical protein BURPSS13_P1052 [Burkholderia 